MKVYTANCFNAIFLTFTMLLGGVVLCAAADSDSQQDSTSGAATPAPAPSRAISFEERGDIFMARKNYADAEDYYYRALKQSSYKDPEVWNKLGIAFQVEGKFHNAIKAFSRAVHLNKDFAEAWNNTGTVYYMEKKYGRSVKYYQRAIELKNDNASFHVNIGTSYYHLKRFDLAVEEYRTALGIDPKIMTLQSAVGTVVHTTDEDVQFYFYMAKAYASIGDADNAVRYLRRALEDGFKDQKRIDEDADFHKISQYPAFVDLMKNPPVAIKN